MTRKGLLAMLAIIFMCPFVDHRRLDSHSYGFLLLLSHSYALIIRLHLLLSKDYLLDYLLLSKDYLLDYLLLSKDYFTAKISQGFHNINKNVFFNILKNQGLEPQNVC